MKLNLPNDADGNVIPSNVKVMADKTGVARLRQAIENQRDAGEACFTLPIGEATAICDECEDELARLAWAVGVPAPLDANGRTVPLDTRELVYKGETRYVYNIAFIPTGSVWSALLVGVTDRARLSACALPDSWEEMEEDLDRGVGALDYEVCAYFRKTPCECPSCIAGKSRSCEQVFMRDVASRIRKLRGADE